jgi:alpha-glucosidase
MTRIYTHLSPYLRTLSAEAAATGLPIQRPVFLHFEADRRTYAIQDAYLYGPDLLVAPVWHGGATGRAIYLPAGAEWVHVWSGKTFAGGQEIVLPAPFGRPAVLHRAGSRWRALFAGLAGL